MSGTTSIDSLPFSDTNNGQGPVQLQVSETMGGNMQQVQQQPQQTNIQNEKVDAAAAMRRLEEERNKVGGGNMQQQQQQMQQSMSSEEASMLVSGIQNASQAGVLSLPNRDIPMVNSQVKMDQEARVNYVPSSNAPDYIGNTQTADEIIAHSNKMKSREDTMDSIYDELQTPVLICILFFVFMLPSVRGFLFKSFPMLLLADGNPSLGGYVYIAVLFGLIYYVLNKLLHHFSQV